MHSNLLQVDEVEREPNVQLDQQLKLGLNLNISGPHSLQPCVAQQAAAGPTLLVRPPHSRPGDP